MRILNKLGLTVASAALLTTTLFVPQTSEAVPSFARQTGMSCNACHTNFPALNSFGRAFKSSGYTMQGAAPMLSGENFSLPANLNTSLITKIRLEKPEGKDFAVVWPDEAAILIGGRASENIGFLLEQQLGGLHTSGIDTTDPTQTNGEAHTTAFANFKAHFNVTDNFATVVFGTDGAGVSYGFELLNTGVYRLHRAVENRKVFSAPQKLGLDGEATGIALVYHTNDYFVNYTTFVPAWGPNLDGIHTKLPMAHYVRAAMTKQVGQFDMGYGVAIMAGEADTDAGLIKAESTTVDFQAQGEQLSFYATYTTVPTGNHYSGTKDKSGLGFLVGYDINPGKTNVHFGYMNADSGTGTAKTDMTLGGMYYFAQNIRLDVFHTIADGSGNDKTTFQLSGGW